MSLLEFDRLCADCRDAGFGHWPRQIGELLRDRTSDDAHGKCGTWRHLIDSLPSASDAGFDLNGDAVTVGIAEWSTEQLDSIKTTLQDLRPWRKGPFEICGIPIDSEWRSEMKWQRLAGEISPLNGRLVLDVGCGNGYYAMRMRGCGARLVIGLEPTLQYVIQFAAISHFIAPQPVHVLPLRLEESIAGIGEFDTTFSMGVLYHQRSPIDHLRHLHATLRKGGELVLETLVLPGNDARARTPRDRYARMRNVWLLPTIAELTTWLERSGFTGNRLVDVSVTTVEEQRATAWMTFESLEHALDAEDPSLTVEGWPAPRRAIVISKRP